MIKVLDANVTKSEVEIVVTAARFFADRLILPKKQKKLIFNIEITDKPGRQSIAIKWLVSSNGFLGLKPPQKFEMTVSLAAGVKDGLEIVANEIVHIAQVISGRLKILKKRKRTS